MGVTSGLSLLQLASPRANATGHGEHSKPCYWADAGQILPHQLRSVKAHYDGHLPISEAFFLFLKTH